MKGIVPVNFILMANTIKSTTKPFKIFDLKGSMTNRYVDPGEDDEKYKGK